MRVAETFIVTQTGIGKPDYSRIVTAARERRGIYLGYGQTLKTFSLVCAPSATGVHTGGLHATIMTDATATFLVNELVGLAIVNVTDGSSGVVIANTLNTVTVVALAGGLTNQWNFGNIYSVAGIFSWVVPRLAPGASQHVIDCETGLPTPFNVPIGYTFTVIAAASAVTEDALAWGYMDGILILTMGMAPGGQTYFENKLAGISTVLTDPTAQLPHTLDVVLTNRGLGNLEGTVDYLCILESVGTLPLPKVKTVKCKWCGHEHEVPNETTNIICPNCGQLFIVYDLSKLRKTP